MRWRSTARALVPAARALPLPTLAGVAGVAAVPSVVVLASGGTDHTGALLTAALVVAATVAFAVDDPAGETLAASPTSLARRRLLRLATILMGAAATMAVLLAVAGSEQPLPLDGLGRQAPAIAATAAVALAVAGLAHPRTTTAAHGGAVAGLLIVVIISAFAYRYHGLPVVTGSQHPARWWWLAMGAAAVAGWSWRDPAR